MMRTGRVGYASAQANRGRVGSAAAPAARCRKFAAGKFHFEPPSRFTSLDHLVGAREQRRRHSRPSAFAVLRLITNSYFVGACTGRSAGFSPLRMRST